MPYGSVKLIPGINVEKTPTANEAGISESQLVRFRDGLVQKMGGWQKFYSFSIAGTPRDLHAWQDLNAGQHLLAGTTSSLNMITGNSLANITPQQLSSNFTPNFSVVANGSTVTVADPNINNVTIYDSVMFNTPIVIGSTIISGLFPIVTTLGGTGYTIQLSGNAGTTSSNTGTLPKFQAATSSNLVSVLMTAHGIGTGGSIAFQATTSLAGMTIYGYYPITYTDANNFKITASAVATSAASTFMNNGSASLQYFINIGPSSSGSGYGTGGYGDGGYGTGVSGSDQTGSPITATDWTSDNWGQIAMANAMGGPIYQYDPTGGFQTASIIATAPPFNSGIFISNTLQIMFAYGSTTNATIGQILDPMMIRWCDLSNYYEWATKTTNQAGSFRLPIGSVIRGGMAMANQNLFWTDLDLWAANYAGYPLVFGFNKIGAGAGLISSHAAQALRDGVHWMGPSNFYRYSGGQVSVIPCPVWDFVFQNLNTGSDANGRPYTANIRSMPNTPFNEAGWLFPSSSSANGENDSYVKVNLSEPNAPWDCGSIARSAWIDQTVLGSPIAASPNGIIYQQEQTNDADGSPITASFTTGYFYIGEGEDYAFVDDILPDMKWGTYGGSESAQVSISFNVVNWPTDTPVVYGPYVMTANVQHIPVRIRGRMMSITLESSDLASFWRLGRIKYRWAPAGRVG